MTKVKAALALLVIHGFIATLRNLVVALTGNLNFPNLPYTVAQLTTALDELDALQDQVMQGIKLAKLQRDNKRKQVTAMVSAMVDYINGTAKGDQVRLATTGLPFVKERAAQPVPGDITKIAAKNMGVSGSVEVFHSAAPFRKMYFGQYGTSPTGDTWIDLPVITRNSFQVHGLTVGQTYYFRVAGANGAGQGNWSDLAKVTIAA